MLLAAMILGLIGGVMYFVGGISAVTAVSWGDILQGHTGPPWWSMILIPIGLIAFFGGLSVYWNPKLGGPLLALAAVAATVAGIASFEQILQMGITMLPMHSFGGPLLYVPVPLLSLVIGAALAYAAMTGPGLPTRRGSTFLR